MNGKALGTTLLAAMGMIHSLCAAIDTNTVGWASTEAVQAYIDGLWEKGPLPLTDVTFRNSASVRREGLTR